MATDAVVGLSVGRQQAPATPTPDLLRLARAVVAATALVPLLAYVVVAAARLRYPYELEWLEGGAVEMVKRVVDGRSLYVAPSVHYAAYPYTPLYFWISAQVAHVSGVGFLPLRLVSFASSLGCMALLFHLVRRETGDRVAGLVAAGLFAATYRLCLAWFDIGRVDSLALLFVLATVAAARRVSGRRAGTSASSGSHSRGYDVAWGIGVGMLGFAAFFTKQSGLIAVGPVLVFLAIRRPWAGVPAVATLVSGVAGSTAALDAATHGWYGWFVFDELARQGIDRRAILGFVPDDLLGPMACAVVLAVVGMALSARRGDHREARWFFGVAAAAMTASSYVGEVHAGGSGDVLMPACAAVALLGGLGYGWLAGAVGSAAATWRKDGRSAVLARAPTMVLVGLVVGQVAMLGYNPTSLVPSAADAAAGRQFVALVASRPGEVLVYDHPWYATMAGKPSFAQGEAIHDVLRAGPSAARTALLASLRSVLTSPGLTTVIVDGPVGELRGRLDRGWRAVPITFGCDACFYPPSDLAERPSVEFVRDFSVSSATSRAEVP